MKKEQRKLLSTLVEQGTIQDAQSEPMNVPSSEMGRSAKNGDRILLAAFVVGWHLFLLLAMSPATSQSRAILPTPTRLAILPVSDGDTDGERLTQESRAMWSPVLLSLPSALGFSGGVKEQTGSSVPLFEPARQLPLYSTMRTRPSVPDPSSTEALDHRVHARLAQPDRGNALTYQPMLPPTHQPWFVMPLHGFPAAALQRPAGSLAGLQKYPGPWEIEAALVVGDLGQVTSVRLMKSSGKPELDAELVREIRRWSVAKGRTERSLHVRILSFDSPAPVAQAEGDNPS